MIQDPGEIQLALADCYTIYILLGQLCPYTSFFSVSSMSGTFTGNSTTCCCVTCGKVFKIEVARFFMLSFYHVICLVL
jgi:hypothetical protein